MSMGKGLVGFREGPVLILTFGVVVVALGQVHSIYAS